MSVFHPLERQNSFPQAITLDVQLLPRPDEAWEMRVRFDRPAQWLSLLNGQLKVAIRGGTFSLRGHGVQFTLPEPTPQGLQLQQQTLTDCQGRLAFTEAAEVLDFSCGEIKATASSSQFQATFTVTPADVAIAESQGLWPPDFSPNQLAIADRLIAQFLVKDYFPTALSWGQWTTDSSTPWQSFDDQPQESRAEKEAILGDRLAKLAHSPQTDLFTLARLVGLDPMQNLAGGKFMGANLSGLDWSNAQLMHSNFRGAILTDADLSGANLQGSNFRGADLSGAYLEGANLSECDFRKSSLALANLIGVDLTHANLVGATISNANFSRAIFHQSQWGDNPGMTPTLQTTVIENGAQIISESDPEVLS